MGARIYVGNLPFTANEQDVRSLFESNGRGVREVKIIEDRDTGRPRGFAFVEMNTDAEADAAIQELNGVAFGGRTLTVNLARDREGGRGGGGAHLTHEEPEARGGDGAVPQHHRRGLRRAAPTRRREDHREGDAERAEGDGHRHRAQHWLMRAAGW